MLCGGGGILSCFKKDFNLIISFLKSLYNILIALNNNFHLKGLIRLTFYVKHRRDITRKILSHLIWHKKYIFFGFDWRGNRFFRAYLLEGIHDSPIESFNTQTAKFKIRWEGLRGIKDVWVTAIRQEGSVQECFCFKLNALIEELNGFEFTALNKIWDKEHGSWR